MNTVYIRGLRAEAVIGIHPWEREIRQGLVLDLDMASDTSRAAASDRIEDALDYAAIADAVTALVEASEYQLIETLAEAVARTVCDQFGVRWLRLQLSKPDAVDAADAVGVVIEWGEKS